MLSSGLAANIVVSRGRRAVLHRVAFYCFLLANAGSRDWRPFLVILAPLLHWFCTPLFPDYAVLSETPFRMDLLRLALCIDRVA